MKLELIKEFLFEDLKWFLRDFYRRLKNIPSNTKRIIQWIPILWSDRDFDYAYLLKIMQFKMKRMRKHIVDHNILLRANQIAKQIKFAEDTIDRITSEHFEYHQKEEQKIQEKWGDLKISFQEIKDNSENGIISTYSEKTQTKEEEKQAHKERLELYRKQEEALQKDYDRLFRHMRRYIQNWWD